VSCFGTAHEYVHVALRQKTSCFLTIPKHDTGQKTLPVALGERREIRSGSESGLSRASPALSNGRSCSVRGSAFQDRRKQDVFAEGLHGRIHGRSGKALPRTEHDPITSATLKRSSLRHLRHHAKQIPLRIARAFLPDFGQDTRPFLPSSGRVRPYAGSDRPR